jgi:hypothetical protein
MNADNAAMRIARRKIIARTPVLMMLRKPHAACAATQ